MFKEAYERKLNGNYLILEEENLPADKNEFECRMIQENIIPGFLQCTTRYINGREQFAYDITSRQSLKRFFEEQDIGYRDMKSILLGMMRGFDAITEYFLNEENLILLPEYIYIDIETKQAFLCFYPHYHVNIHQSFQNFAEYLLQKTDHSDEEAVVLAYAFYKQTSNEDYNLYHLFEKMAQKDAEDCNAKRRVPEYKEERNRLAGCGLKDHQDVFLEIPELAGGNALIDGFMEADITDIIEEDKISSDEITKYGIAEKRIFLISVSALLLLTGFVLYIEVYRPVSVMTFLPYETRMVLIAVAGAVTLLSSITLLGRQRKKRRAFEREQRRKRRIRQQTNEKREEALAEKSYCGKTGSLRKSAEPVRRLVRFTEEEITEFKLNKTPFIIGKKRVVADGVLTNPAVSRMHAKIYREKDNYYLMDLNSTNGTSKNGIRLNANESMLLTYNDEITFAGELFYFR